MFDNESNTLIFAVYLLVLYAIYATTTWASQTINDLILLAGVMFVLMMTIHFMEAPASVECNALSCPVEFASFVWDWISGTTR